MSVQDKWANLVVLEPGIKEVNDPEGGTMLVTWDLDWSGVLAAARDLALQAHDEACPFCRWFPEGQRDLSACEQRAEIVALTATSARAPSGEGPAA